MSAVRRVLLLVLGVLVVTRPVAVDAQECWCGTSVHSALATSGVAFIGTPTGVGQDANADPVWMFDVEEVLRGPVGESAAISTDGECADIEVPVGIPVGVIAWLSGRVYVSSTCGGIWDPAVLAGAAAGLPTPGGGGSVEFFVNAWFGDARTAGLDAAGVPLAYGFGPGFIREIAACPGGRYGLELVGNPETETVTLEKRSFVTWEVEETFDVTTATTEGRGTELSCHDQEGAGSIALVGGTEIAFVGSGQNSTVAVPLLRAATSAAEGVYAAAGEGGHDVVRVDASGGVAPVGTLPDARGARAIAVSPDGFQLAIVVGPEPFDPATPPNSDGIALLSAAGGTGRLLELSDVTGTISEIAWLGSDRIAVHWEDRVSVFDLRGQLLGDLTAEGTIKAATETDVWLLLPAEGPHVAGETYGLASAPVGGVATPVAGTVGMWLADVDRVEDGVEPSAGARARIAPTTLEPRPDLPPVPLASGIAATALPGTTSETPTPAIANDETTVREPGSASTAAESTALGATAPATADAEGSGVGGAAAVAVACFVLAGALVLRAVLPLVWRRRG